MSAVFERTLVIPLGAVAVAALALAGVPEAVPALLTLCAVGILAFSVRAIVRRMRAPHPHTEVLPPEAHAPVRTRTTHTGDTIDLLRMDDDGGQQLAKYV